MSGLDWPNRFIGAGLGAGLEALVPNKPAPVAGVALAEGALVAAFPKRPPEGKDCWAGLWLPAGGRLNMFPLNPEKPFPSAGWFWLVVPMLANGLLLLFEVAAEKLKDEAPPLLAPPPKENGEDVPFVGWLAPGKLWDWPKLKPFVGGAGDSGVGEFVV